MADPQTLGNWKANQGGFGGGTTTPTLSGSQNRRQQFPNSYDSSQQSKDVWNAPDQSQFMGRTADALLQGAGINTNNLYGTGGQWAQDQMGPMYWLMRARMALDPQSYGTENNPNAVGNYFGGGAGLNGQANQGGGFGFLADPNAGIQSAKELLYGDHSFMGDPTDRRTALLNEFNQNPQLMAQGLSGMLTAGEGGDYARYMANYIQNIVRQTVNNPAAMQQYGSPIAAVASRLGMGT